MGLGVVIASYRDLAIRGFRPIAGGPEWMPFITGQATGLLHRYRPDLADAVIELVCTDPARKCLRIECDHHSFGNDDYNRELPETNLFRAAEIEAIVRASQEDQQAIENAPDDREEFAPATATTTSGNGSTVGITSDDAGRIGDLLAFLNTPAGPIIIQERGITMEPSYDENGIFHGQYHIRNNRPEPAPVEPSEEPPSGRRIILPPENPP